MNIRDIIKPAMTELEAKKEGEFKAALDDFWGAWSLEDVKRRCQIISRLGDPVEILYADGVPILEIHPIHFGVPELVGDRYVQRVTQNFRRLAPRRNEQ